MEDLPLRLLIGIVILGLTVPAIVSGLSAYETQQMTVRVTQEIERLVQVAQQFYLSGGGAEDVRLHFDGGMTAKVESIAIGDVPGGPLATSASYRLSGQQERFLLSDPPVPMAGPDGPLRLGPGVHTVRVSYEGDGPVRLAAIA